MRIVLHLEDMAGDALVDVIATLQAVANEYPDAEIVPPAFTLRIMCEEG